MTDLNNQLNINVRKAYTPNMKKESPEVKAEEAVVEETIMPEGNSLNARDSYGRALVKKAEKTDNPEMVKRVKEATEIYMKNSEQLKDDMAMIDLACALGGSYEDACCGQYKVKH